MEEENKFDFVKYLSKMKTAHIQINDPEEYLFNIVSCCLLKEIRYYDSSEQRCSVLLSSLNKVATEHNAEFILKLAVYLRNQLYIRTTTNFLIAFSCLHEKTKQYVKKYFGVSVLLPTDLIEVCSYIQFLVEQMKKEQNKQEEQKMELEDAKDIRRRLFFPKVLRECIAEKFPQFSLYQLGKYCSDGARKKMLQEYLQFKNIKKYKEIKEKKKKKDQEKAKNENPNKKILLKKNIKKHQKLKNKVATVFKKNQFDVKFLCMKDIVSYCHLKAPQYPIRCILGVKYPQTEAEFNELFKEEIEKYKLKSNKNEMISFNKDLANKRMKLDIPNTWETKLSSQGNKKEVWEELIMSNSVPYMAMIRNLRNILKAGVSDVIHQKVIAKLTDKDQVKNSKMFPFQYFSALVEVDKMVNKGENYEELKEQLMEQELAKIIQKADAGEYNSDAFDPEVKVEQQITEMKKKVLLLPAETKTIINQVGPLYKQAINQAISIAVDQNLEAIRGLTIVFADVSGSMQCPVSGGKRYGSIRNCMDIAILFGLMIRSKCANCQFYLFSSPGAKKNKLYQKVKLLKGDDYLENLKLCKEQNKLGGGNTGFPGDLIKKYQQKKIKIDNIIILSDLMISVNYSEGMDYGIDNNNNNRISDVLNEYRNLMNEHLKIFSIDLRGYSQQLNLSDEFNEQNYIRIFGMSESVLKFISLRESSQMQEIHNFAEVKVAEYENNLKK